MALFLFFGEDTYSLRKKLNFWKKEFEKKYGGDMNVSVFAGNTATANEIFQASSSAPFLAEKRLVIVKDFLAEGEEQERTAMTDLLEKIPDFCTLVFSEYAAPDRRTGIWKKLQKLAKITEFTPMTGGKLLGWIEDQVQARGGSIEKDAAIELTELVGNDLFRLENEIAKLVGFAGERAITKQDLDLLVDTKLETSIFRLTDAIGQKNRRVAISTLHQLIDTGEKLHGILSMIMRQFRIITGVKDLASQGLRSSEIAVRLKEHPFAVSNTLAQVKNFSLDQIKRAYALLIETDYKLKSGGIKILVGDNRELVLALDRLVLDLCA